jgi:hypothetical protein
MDRPSFHDLRTACKLTEAWMYSVIGFPLRLVFSCKGFGIHQGQISVVTCYRSA